MTPKEVKAAHVMALIERTQRPQPPFRDVTPDEARRWVCIGARRWRQRLAALDEVKRERLRPGD